MDERPRHELARQLRFVLRVARETFGARRFARVLEGRLQGRAIDASGTELVPRDGPVVFAVNHYHAGLTLDVVSATLLAAARERPAVADECAVVVGHRMRAASNAFGRVLAGIVRAFAGWFFARWRTNVLRIRSTRERDTHTRASETFSLAGLRAFRACATSKPTLVFPEGIARRELGAMRDGVGPWLASLRVPVMPVAVWWSGVAWRVSFGAPVLWSARRELRDVQLGLAIAALLPQELAPDWIETLDRWRAAHAEVDTAIAS